MKLKYSIVFFLITLGFCCSSQNSLLAIDHSSFALRQKPVKNSEIFLSEKTFSFKGSTIGASFQFRVGDASWIGLGLGLTKIEYEKQWLGHFPENNKFGVAILKTKVSYLSVPLSAFINCGPRYRRFSRSNRPSFGITFTYIPSFMGTSDLSIATYAAADSSKFFSAYRPALRQFQHSLIIGLCCQRSLFNNTVRFSIEPFVGCASRYFKGQAGSAIFTYGLKLRLGFLLPKLSIVKQVSPGNAEEKKKILEQKEKEINDQLNKQP